MADIEWNEEQGQGSRRLSCWRGSGYEALITVSGNDVSARLWRPAERRDTFAVPPHAVPAAEVERTVEALREEIESRLEALESGHS